MGSSILSLTPDRRAAFLDEACENAPDVRRQIEALLSDNDALGQFMAEPTVTSNDPSHAPLIAHAGPFNLNPGSQVGRYSIVGPLGAGGMGEVYKARDIELARLVALKFLPAALVGNPIALERLRREARAASALNHPNICTIYEIGKFENASFIAMELVDGFTLKHLISGRALDVEVLNRKQGVQSAQSSN
jgi:hypothetical protein